MAFGCCFQVFSDWFLQGFTSDHTIPRKLTTNEVCVRDEGPTSNPVKISNILNKHFASVGQKFGRQLSSSSRHFAAYYKNTTYLKSFFLAPVARAEVESQTVSIPSNKTYVFYSSPTIKVSIAVPWQKSFISLSSWVNTRLRKSCLLI